jgi:hypothetical protein
MMDPKMTGRAIIFFHHRDAEDTEETSKPLCVLCVSVVKNHPPKLMTQTTTSLCH